MTQDIKLKPVTKNDVLFLYDLLKTRDPEGNISHKKMPSYSEHMKFVMSRPYTNWYIVEYNKKTVGSIYLSKRDEIGISINNDSSKYSLPPSPLIYSVPKWRTISTNR